MIITDINQSTGSFTGTYNSAAGEAFEEYELQGHFDTEGSSLGWVVSYSYAHSTSAWSGQVQMLAGEEPMIQTTWVLLGCVYCSGNRTQYAIAIDPADSENERKRFITNGKIRTHDHRVHSREHYH